MNLVIDGYGGETLLGDDTHLISTNLEPIIEVGENKPEILAQNLRPKITTEDDARLTSANLEPIIEVEENRPEILAQDLRPEIMTVR